MTHLFNRVGNAPRFVFQISNTKFQAEQSRPDGHAVKRTNANRPAAKIDSAQSGQLYLERPSLFAEEKQTANGVQQTFGCAGFGFIFEGFERRVQ